MFQSTPPRGGRLSEGENPNVYHDVSIHAPARGATVLLLLAILRLFVSIHAPARGATTMCSVSIFSPQSFNPRPRAGGDPRRSSWPRSPLMFQSTPPRGGRRELFRGLLPLKHVSIHAPARGATDRHGRGSLATESFNPRPRAGGDVVFPVFPVCAHSFNPRPRAGGDGVERAPAGQL